MSDGYKGRLIPFSPTCPCMFCEIRRLSIPDNSTEILTDYDDSWS